MKLKPILLATDKILENGVTSDGKWFFGEEGFGCFVDNDKDIIQHHLYLVDESADIKGGDWYYDMYPSGAFGVGDGNPISICHHPEALDEGTSKIIATTDNLYNIKHDDTVSFPKGEQTKVPKLSEQTIKFIINNYNESGVLFDFVEVEEIPFQNYARERLALAGFKIDNTKLTHHIKLNPQGEVDITLPEEKLYTKAEVEKLIVLTWNHAYNLGSCDWKDLSKECIVKPKDWVKTHLK